MHKTNGERIPQYLRIFSPVIAEPSFPKCECTNTVVRDGGLAVCEDVLDGLSGPEFYAAPKELLCSAFW